ncbi:MAG: flagellar type III secretion system pore protein FliP [Pseudomonadota bacterium]
MYAASINDLTLDILKMTPAEEGVEKYSVNLQILLIMTALTILPALIMMTTAFTRIIIVFSILRQAIGLQQSPSNQILIGMALFLTFFIMAPVWQQINQKAMKPFLEDQITSSQAMDNGIKPLREFMLAQTRETDLNLFMRLGGYEKFTSKDEIPVSVLLPSFMTSELKTAFQIGFIIFIPFLIIDLVVASVLMAMGMMMLSPMLVSLPFKIMLFVFVDGWTLIIGSLASSFRV